MSQGSGYPLEVEASEHADRLWDVTSAGERSGQAV